MRRGDVRLAATTWLSDSTLLIVGSFERADGPIDQVFLVRDDSTIQLRARWSTYQSNQNPHTRWLILAHGSGRIRQPSGFGLSLSGDEHPWHIDAQTVALSSSDLQTVLREQFAALGASERNSIVGALASSASDAVEDSWANRLQLGRSLQLTRDVLRERSPLCDLNATRIEGLSVEAIMALDESSFYVEGWLCDVESAAVRLTAVSPEGARTEILSTLFRYERLDVEAFFRPSVGEQPYAKYGFISYFNVATPSLLPTGWLLEMETTAGTSLEAMAPPSITSNNEIRANLLGDLFHDVGPSQDLRRFHISPALQASQSHLANRVRVSGSMAYGRQAPNPDVSILVPLYGRIDLLEHQMAQFTDDPGLRGAELIYVLDSPELADDLLGMTERLFRLYGMPFRVLVLSENAGFSTANNFAASFARGRLLVLMNSDVLPQRPGWLSKMVAFYGSLERPGAVGPKLIYEDDSLQHAGLFFERPQESRIWTNEHYYKGLHSDLPAANIARRVPAITGACLMIDSQVYADIGGMSGLYLQGDYEDSDLCLRLSAQGLENWYFPGAVLYHLEAQSYPTASRETNRQYNRWLFNEVWGGTIDGAGPQFAAASRGARYPADGVGLPTPTKQSRSRQSMAPNLLKGNGVGGKVQVMRRSSKSGSEAVSGTPPEARLE